MEMEKNNNVTVDPSGLAFAKSMELLTYVGLAAMLIPGVLYLFGVHPFLDVHVVAAHWGEPASKFWEGVGGMTIHGYSWFLSHLTAMDMLCIGGVAILGLVPLFSITAAAVKAKGPARVLLLILLCEFAFAIVKPLVMGGVGE
ncbi:hypothetical protein G3N55_00655 [Dissulfurirhabdus thermomarina]|uniref:DUF1634 domain-containing protein n=1 Tax=Dissulfurirhabdus thermomarina TaxID=1765737 RepID=A0A6N9TJC6_DISTH|nr:hypothetical protein [Dissulfurirhabdus thermomarina]NDY41361.1 hypothetical protein [Dissulfurirhabdus thermomarina]NMX23256.1 hypothetical protein [Dissulfurirhabdus thermomarina]